MEEIFRQIRHCVVAAWVTQMPRRTDVGDKNFYFHLNSEAVTGGLLWLIYKKYRSRIKMRTSTMTGGDYLR